MILYALFFTPCAISSICSSCFVYPRISQNSEIGTPDTLALDHATISESPCSPMIHACTDLASTCKCSPSRYFNLAESKVVPEPKTLFSGNPDNLTATCVRISTGFATIKRIPSQFLFAISGIMDLKIATFFFTRSSLVSPGFCPAPAVTTMIAASTISS